MNDIEITIEMFEPEVDVVNLASTPRKRVRDVGARESVYLLPAICGHVSLQNEIQT